MSMQQRLEAMELLWESLRREGIDFPSPAWHAEVLAQRRALADSPAAEWLTLEQLQVRLG